MSGQLQPSSPGVNTAILLLPGALQKPKDLIDAGFLEAVKARNLAIDIYLTDFETDVIPDITSDLTLERIDLELVQPIQRTGYNTIWLSGISMGGLLALAHNDRYPEKLAGVCLLSPYPGNRLLLREISDCGGLHHWQASEMMSLHSAQSVDTLDAERRMWRCLQTMSRADTSSTRPVYLGYGKKDRFVDRLVQVQAALPDVAADVIDGAHDWPTWYRLWCRFLDQHFVAIPA